MILPAPSLPPTGVIDVQRETIESTIISVANEFNVPASTLYNVAKSESNLDPDPKGHNDGGLACGIVQIHADLWHMDCDELKAKPEIGLSFLAKHIKAGDAWKYWSSLNCYTYVNTKFGFKLPKMSEIRKVTDIPHKGYVAIFWYKDNITGESEKHIALITSEVSNGSFTVTEANFKTGVIGTRSIAVDDPHLAGYWTM